MPGDHVADMVNLTTLDESAMLQNLKNRFEDGEVYTLTGRIVVSVNPFRWLPLYSEDLVVKYHTAEDPFSTEDPHVYSIAHAALNEVALQASRGQAMTSQSILVSGESGAGKTEATKICMRYLAIVDTMCSVGGLSDARTLTEQVLQTSPILEAFGNAQTVRNDNSSRFGKFLQLQYSADARQLGAYIDTYLLERSRVVAPPEGEQNFHIFMLVVDGCDAAEREKLGLAQQAAYPSMPAGNGRRTAAQSQEEWEKLVEAMGLVGFGEEKQHNLFSGIVGVLNLCQLTFEGSDDAEGNRVASVKDTGGFLSSTATHLGVEPPALAQALCTRRIFLPTGDTYIKPLDEQQAADGANALAKAVYGRMFDAIVLKLNALISSKGADAGATDKERRSREQKAFIGILDIFGFESFQTNSFEQLCINFANEMLQQQFNADVFRQQQKEYEAEGIPWQSITYQDNGPVLDLIRGKRDGILTLLDEECRLQQGSPKTFVTKLTNAHSKSDLLSVPRIQRGGGDAAPQFCVTHYAGKVEYDTSLFLVKNTDPLHPELVEMMQASANAYFSSLFEAQKAGDGKKDSGNAGKRGALFSVTVGGRFKEQLANLMKIIESTQVHYIRCVKPNAENVQQVFTEELVGEQLRCAGMMEAVRIARAAYPHRLPRAAVAKRFAPLARHAAPNTSAAGKLVFAPTELRHLTTQQLRGLLTRQGVPFSESAKQEELVAKADAAGAEGLVELLKILLPGGGYALGKTKIFFKGSELPALETRRQALASKRAVQIQAHVRRVAAAKFYRQARAAIPRIQAYARRRAARKLLQRMRRESDERCKAATLLQSYFRMAPKRKLYLRMRQAAVMVQKFARMHARIRIFKEMVEKARVQRTYEGQLREARQRLEKEASERDLLAQEKGRLQADLDAAKNASAEAALAAQERRAQAQEYSMLLKQQEQEVQALRDELAALRGAIQSEEKARAAADRKAEEAQVQLSMERASHLKLQKTLALEKEQHGAVKEKLMLKSKVSHLEGERERDKHKLQKTVDAANIRRKEWEREKLQLKRQLENHEAEVRKRDKWLDKAKDIIKEYQKRHVGPPGGGGPMVSPPAQPPRR